MLSMGVDDLLQGNEDKNMDGETQTGSGPILCH